MNPLHVHEMKTSLKSPTEYFSPFLCGEVGLQPFDERVAVVTPNGLHTETRLNSPFLPDLEVLLSFLYFIVLLYMSMTD